MHDWNVVATSHAPHFNLARSLLERLAPVAGTEYYNTLLLRVEEVEGFLRAMLEAWNSDPSFPAAVATVVPARHAFSFSTLQEFEDAARSGIESLLPSLGGRSFHVRIRRRGFRGKISSMEEEQALDRHILKELERSGAPGSVTFTDPDAVVALDTVGNRAGLSLWTREDMLRYPFLKIR